MVTRKDLNHDQTEMQDHLRYRYRMNEIARNRNPEKLREKNLACRSVIIINVSGPEVFKNNLIWVRIQTLDPEAQNATFCNENMQISF
jgi:hypothetical protein